MHRLPSHSAHILSLKLTLARQGAIVPSWRYRAGRKLGPYYRLAYRDQGRQKSIYLGASQALVQKIRALLDEIHRPRERRKEWLRMRPILWASIRQQKAQWNQVVRAYGLYTRGYELRGRRVASDHIRAILSKSSPCPNLLPQPPSLNPQPSSLILPQNRQTAVLVDQRPQESGAGPIPLTNAPISDRQLPTTIKPAERHLC